MALAIATIADSIAALNVTGLMICDLDQIPEAATTRTPILFPKPDGFVTDFEYEPVSQGDGATALANVTYTLTYRFCYTPIGAERGLFATYPAMVAMAAAILDAIISIDNATAGAVEIVPLSIPVFGPVVDPANNGYHGCDISLLVKEFVN